ncbi:hypothetical protein ACQUW5_08320 [Legionella sp. CNM-1927-20]|uniref:hypothetical protein n=1 Tax=Legionella sp. CNM-1927-20 TaxID=3422221 RepID=UPI00403AB5DE
MPKISELSQKTVREIHNAILQNDYLKNAAGRLETTSGALRTHLRKFTYQDEKGEHSLTFAAMKNLWPTEDAGEKAWGDDYDKPMCAAKVDINKKTLCEIHRVILGNSLSAATSILGINPDKLQKRLSEFAYFEKGKWHKLTYEALKYRWRTEDAAKKALGDAYKLPMSAVYLPNTNVTLSRDTGGAEQSLDDVSSQAMKNKPFEESTKDQVVELESNVTDVTSSSLSGTFSYSFFKEAQTLKRKPPAEELTAINKTFLKEIARVIHETGSESEAADKLGTTPKLLRDSLLEVVGIDYDDIKKQTEKYKTISIIEDVVPIDIVTSNSTAKSQRNV